MNLSTRLELLEIRSALVDLISSAAQAFDNCDRELLRSTFHQDATVDLGELFGRHDGVAAILASAEEFWAAASSMHHWTANPLLEIDPAASRATGSTALDCVCTFADGGTYHCGGRYADTFARVDWRWTISRRRYEVQFMTPLPKWEVAQGTEAPVRR
jgi:SnoaL-like domain